MHVLLSNRLGPLQPIGILEQMFYFRLHLYEMDSYQYLVR